VYGAAALWLMYMTWPYLWDAPIARLMEGIAFTGNVSAHTLYRGSDISTADLPWHYFPTLATIELTEPVVALFVVGMAVAVWRWAKARVDRATLGVVALWFAVPLVALIGLGMGIYNNIRQLHFVLVPVFLVAGIGLAVMMAGLRRVWLQYSLLALLLIPSLIGMVRLHPYEYVYFNAYTGGVLGAKRQYAMDYWCTSYREAMEFVNPLATPGDVIMAFGTDAVARPFAREGLQIVRNAGGRRPTGVDILLTCANWLWGTWGDTGLVRVHTVSREGVELAEVFMLAEGGEPAVPIP